MKSTKAFLTVLLFAAAISAAAAGEWKPSQDWPVLNRYDDAHLFRVALPLGGIGTGTVSLGGRGELKDWEIMNIPGKGFHTCEKGNGAPFFAVYCRPEGGEAVTKMLAGRAYEYEYMHCMGQPVDNYGLPRFKDASFESALLM